MNVITRTPLRVRHQAKLRLVQVASVQSVSPRMRRIVLAGDALDGFTTAAADDHVKLLFPAPGQTKPPLPLPGADRFSFPAGVTPPAIRDYTPRRFDPATNQLTIEFVLHGDGPAATWASQAAPGMWLGVAGPRGSLLVPEDFDAYLLVGDETALPAIARRLEEMPAGARAIVLIEVADGAEERYLPTAANASITWLHRGATAPGTAAPLATALRDTALPQGETHAWLAGEIETIRALRTHLVQERHLPREHVRAAGYWRIGETGAHARVDD
jgi:NADPH-dependent ferric siderophore reductase